VLTVISLLVASGLLSFSLVGWSYVLMKRIPTEEVSKMFENRPITFAFVIVWLVLMAFSVPLNFKRRAKAAPREGKSVNQ
jgi:hypothetical protein